MSVYITRFNASPKGKGRERRRALMIGAFGNWERRGVIEVYVPHDVDYDHDAYVETIAENLATGLCDAAFPIYSRS